MKLSIVYDLKEITFYGFKFEFDFYESKINLNYALDYEAFLDDLIGYDTLCIIKEVLN